MKPFLMAACAATVLALVPASAQTTAPATAPAATAPATPVTPVTPPSMKLTDQQAKDWIDKAVYSSDSKKLGEVAAFARDTAGNVTEMHADIGGFLGIGETRVRVMPADFKLTADRAVLSMTADQAKSLPKVVK